MLREVLNSDKILSKFVFLGHPVQVFKSKNPLANLLHMTKEAVLEDGLEREREVETLEGWYTYIFYNLIL